MRGIASNVRVLIAGLSSKITSAKEISLRRSSLFDFSNRLSDVTGSCAVFVEGRCDEVGQVKCLMAVQSVMLCIERKIQRPERLVARWNNSDVNLLIVANFPSKFFARNPANVEKLKNRRGSCQAGKKHRPLV